MFLKQRHLDSAGPSVLTLGFDCGEMKDASDYIKIQLIDGLLGKYGHSALFKHFREKDLAVYHVITRYDVMNNFFACFNMYRSAS